MFVLDASAHAKLFLDDVGFREYRAWFKERVEEGDAVLAPSLLGYELGRVIEREYVDEPVTIQQEVHRRSIANVDLRPIDWGRSFEVATMGLTFYDASYVALADEASAILVTGDDGMREGALQQGVEVLAL